MFKIILIIFAAFVLLLSGVLVIVFYFWNSTTAEVNTNKPPEQISNVAKTTTPKPKGERDAKLQRETDALLPLFDRMRSVPIYLTNEPIQKGEEGKEGGVAYNVCERDNPTIYMKKAFYNKGNQKQITNILKHELTHAYFCRQGIQAGHDERFRKKFTEVGGFGN
ncbi:MAG TPA: hypothetical protein PKE69_24050 [Pyrinomonadaceae bacterium]|nr:hypothetical protein [Pyrinomonadaceae bacterium]